MRPEASPQSRLCLEFDASGLTAYCNRQALIALRDQLEWLIQSPPEDRYHCHVLMTLENDASRFDGKRPRNAGVSFSDDFEKMRDADIDGGQLIDLTFMVATDDDLDDVQRRQK